jgi:hypothetical protein
MYISHNRNPKIKNKKQEEERRSHMQVCRGYFHDPIRPNASRVPSLKTPKNAVKE